MSLIRLLEALFTIFLCQQTWTNSEDSDGCAPQTSTAQCRSTMPGGNRKRNQVQSAPPNDFNASDYIDADEIDELLNCRLPLPDDTAIPSFHSVASADSSRLSEQATRRNSTTMRSSRINSDINVRCLSDRMDTLEAQQRVIIRLLEDVKKYVQRPSGASNFEFPQGVRVPCGSIEDLRNLNELLSTSKEVRLNIVTALQRFSGPSAADTVRLVCRALLTNSLAKHLNLMGTQSRIGIQATFPSVLSAIQGKSVN